MSEVSDSPSKGDSDETQTSQDTFVCNSAGCNQKFASAKELEVHKCKHQMTLKLGPTKASNLSDVLPIDQTPTPTRFLQFGNQMGLFEELNPFDREFKTAQKETLTSKQRRTANVVHQLQAMNNSTKSKTPTTPNTDANMFQQPVHVITLTPSLSSPVGNLPVGGGQFFVPPLLPSPQGLIPALPGYTASSPMSVPVSMLSPSIMPFAPGLLPMHGMSPGMMADAQRALTKAMFAAVVSASSPTTSNVPLLTNPQDAYNNNNTSISDAASQPIIGNTNANLPRTGSLPSVAYVKQERPQSNSSVKSESTNQMSEVSPPLPAHQSQAMMHENYLQSQSMVMPPSVMVHLPNGQTTCIGIPTTSPPMAAGMVDLTSSITMPTMSNPTMQQALNNHQQANHPTLSMKSSSEFGSNSNLLDAKQKLKETLKSNNPALQHAITTQSMQMSVNSSNNSSSDQPKRRRGRQQQDVDPDIKRQRFLERNRAAASRCRSKKKNWVVGLESKAKTLSQTNVMLQNEITQLKDEIASLKQLLLSHRDCPITKMQQQSMAMAGINLNLEPSTTTTTTSTNNSGVKSENMPENYHQSLTSSLSSNSLDENYHNPNSQSSQHQQQPPVSSGQLYADLMSSSNTATS
uniref:Transcription factor protein n=1 Tax=Ciona intestinalis TaxID=7719 RepID=Q4H3W1_CIOIN|nr:transcription factor protein [Ciona intestinalis]BAE06316.1 transcription factor protein [Ciona intestinalis]|eukprot:NP_001071657.1 transcription factor protein [Ciona intestinalis]